MMLSLIPTAEVWAMANLPFRVRAFSIQPKKPAC